MPGQRSLAGYVHVVTESDTTWATEHTHASLLYNIVLASALQRSRAAMCWHTPPLFWISSSFRSPQSTGQSPLGLFEKETGACSCAGRVRWKGCTIACSVIKAPWVEEGGQWPWAGLDQFNSSWDLTSSLCSFPTQASKVTSLWFCVKIVPQRAIDLEHLIGFLSCIH